MRLVYCLVWLIGVALSFSPGSVDAQPEPARLSLELRHQQETKPGSGRFHTLHRSESWDPARTAIIVCDMWDLHHCLNAVRREKEFAPRLEQALRKLREQGVTVIHAPSECMDFYAEHPARRRAQEVPTAEKLPADIGSWCHRIPAEERAEYPIDQSDGGEDDDPQEHAEWAATLTKMGRNPRAPWKRQIDLLTIDPERDFISDRGDEVWSILASRDIQHVILAGVHTNMCVLGRPFGLRQMARNGKNVVLLRDLTDTMYNPARPPFVSHFTGTDLIVAHIERHVCPTITSDQILGDDVVFRFSGDRRRHVVVVMAEDEYETEQTLPPFALQQLGKDCRVSYVYGSETARNEIPGLEVLSEADLLLISVRRRLLPPEQMQSIRDFVASGKPVVGIRTASHAFSLRQGEVPPSLVAWPEFDAQVFGGNYHGHHGNQLPATISVAPGAADHPLIQGLDAEPFVSGGSLYQTSPLAESTTTLLVGQVEGAAPEPVAWTFERADGGRSFYTSLGHKDDFANPRFVNLLKRAVLHEAE